MPHNLTATCYGRMYDKLDKCDGCEESPWCKDARDPKPLTGPNAGATGDDAAFEALQALETAQFQWGVSAGRVFGAVVECCSERPDRIAAVCMRVSGYSYARIGRACGKTKQAVAKDLACIARVNPEVGAELRKCFHLAGEAGRLNERLAEAADREQRRGERLTGPDGVYGRLAKEYGLSSWWAAYCRHRRTVGKSVDGSQHGGAGQPGEG